MPEKSTDSESPCAREISKISKKTYFSGSGKSASPPIVKLCILSSSSDEEDTSVESPRGVRIFEKKDAGKSFSEKGVDAPFSTGSAIVKNRSRKSACRASGFGSEGSSETACREGFQGEEHLELSVPGEVFMISPAEAAVSNNHLEAAHCGNFVAKLVFTAGFHIVTSDVEMPSDQQPSGITGMMDFTSAAHNIDPVRPNHLEEDSDKDPLQNKSDQSGLRSQFMELHRPNLLDVPKLAATGIKERDPSLPSSEEHGFWWRPVGHGALLTNREKSQLETCMAHNPSTVLHSLKLSGKGLSL
jgi:hypothetical protein